MYNNQQFGQQQMGGMYPQQGGTSYGQFPTAKMTQPLTPEQMKQLRSTGSGFSLKVDEIEILRSQCTHKDNGNIALIKNPDGTSTCTICGATFNLVDKDSAEIQEVTNLVIDVLQSIKTYYLDIPENYVKDYFTMIPYVEKLARFYDVAIHNFTKYENGAFLNNNNNMYGFQMLGALTSPGFGNMGQQMGQPMGGFQQQPMGYGQPQMGYQQPGFQQPQMGYQQQQPMGQPQMGFNPFGGQPMNQQQPVQQPMNNTGFQGQPMNQQQSEQPKTAEQPQTPAAPQVVSTKTFNI